MPRPARSPIRALASALVLSVGIGAAACADPVETTDAGPDAGIEDAEPGDAEPGDAAPMDAAIDAGARGRRVTARGLAPAIFDGTHSVQQPGAAGGTTGGNRALVPGLVRAAVAYGVDGLFLEVHPDPDHAPSDGPNQLDYALLEHVLRESLAIRSALDV